MVIVSQPLDTLLVYEGTAKLRSRMSKVGSLRKLPLGEYSMRITSGVSTSKRASPEITVACEAAVPLAMLMVFDRLTGEVSEVAVCALAGPAVATRSTAATTAIKALPQEATYKVSSLHRRTPVKKSDYDPLLRKAPRGVNRSAVNIALI